MKVLKAARGYVDVFIGDGWDGHSRYQKRRTSKGYQMVHISGAKLKKHQIDQLEKM